MEEVASEVDFRQWDWLPEAALEAENYLLRLLTEAAITAHDVSARAKTITSFLDKCHRKDYSDPVREVTDTVAVRIITYSVTDKRRAGEIIRDRFEVVEDRNPGTDKDERRRGYDCQHFVITGESAEADFGWLIVGGHLARYFDKFGGLEIQIRTVAAHAWAEFEHSRRYKGQPYQAINAQDRETIDQLFAAASDARRALDETFVAIDRVLANPSSSTTADVEESTERVDVDVSEEPTAEEAAEPSETPVDPTSLRAYLADRFPDDEKATEKGMQFACDLVTACGLPSIEALSRALEAINGDQVRRLMDITTSVTRVRRLDDELLARFGESYIQNTGTIGTARKRVQQLEWRYDRLRDKVAVARYNTYEISGDDCPDGLLGVPLSAARAVREMVRIIAEQNGYPAVHIRDAVSDSAEDLTPSTRPRQVTFSDGQSVWVATNLRRDASEALLDQLLQRAQGLDVNVSNSGTPIGTTA